MALLARNSRFFGRKPQKQSTNAKEQEMQYMEKDFDNCEKNRICINEDAWEHLSRSEIKAAQMECAKEEQTRGDLMYELLDAANASARKGHHEPGVDIGTSEVEVEGFVMLNSPHQMAKAFSNLLDHQFDG